MATSPVGNAFLRDDSGVEMRPLEQENHGYRALPRSGSPHIEGPEDELPAYSRDSPHPPRTINEEPLRQQKGWILLWLAYTTLLVVPWILTIVLNYRPLGLASYINEDAFAQSYFNNQDAVRAIQVLNSVVSLMTVPVLSLMLAYGAVAYTQRRNLHQRFSLQQTFTLANGGWANVKTLIGSLRKNRHNGSVYLYLGSFLVLIGAVHQPLRELLLSWNTIYVNACEHPYSDGECSYYSPPSGVVTGYAPSRHYLQLIRRGGIIRTLTSDLVSARMEDWQSLLWNQRGNDLQTLEYYYGDLNSTYARSPLHFIATVPNGTTTGVLQQSALRINSSTTCATIGPDDFPTTCSGSNPFSTFYNTNDTSIGNRNPSSQIPISYEVQVCIPGDVGASPWNNNTNRQDITEELFVQLASPQSTENSDDDNFFAFHCVTNTSLGEFVLGNYNNSNQFSNLSVFPNGAQEEVPAYFHLPYDPSTNSDNAAAPGPLTLTALSLFGNLSFFSAMQNSTNATVTVRTLCNAPSLPLLGLSSYSYNDPCNYDYDPSYVDDTSMQELLQSWLFNIGSGASSLNQAFNSAVWLANKRLLTTAADQQMNTGSLSSIPIVTAPGYAVVKPVIGLAGIIVVSVLLALQVLGMLALAFWNLGHKTWTPTLDALAVARLAVDARFEDGVRWPLIGDIRGDRAVNPKTRTGEVKETRYVAALDRVDGIVGRDVREADGESVYAYFGKQIPRLTLGGLGIMRRKEATLGT